MTIAAGLLAVLIVLMLLSTRPRRRVRKFTPSVRADRGVIEASRTAPAAQATYRPLPLWRR